MSNTIDTTNVDNDNDAIVDVADFEIEDVAEIELNAPLTIISSTSSTSSCCS
jgi:hypothetical protein